MVTCLAKSLVSVLHNLRVKVEHFLASLSETFGFDLTLKDARYKHIQVICDLLLTVHVTVLVDV